MVEDPELPFPESVAASQIHIAGQQGSRAAKILFGNMGFGGLVYLLGQFNLFNPSKDFIVNVGDLGQELRAHGTFGYRSQAERRRCDDVLGARHQPRVPWRGLHHRAAAGFAELLRRRDRVGTAGSADSCFSAVRTLSRSSCPLVPLPTRRFGPDRLARCGASSCARLPLAA